MLRNSRFGLRAAVLVVPVLIAMWLGVQAFATDSDTFVTNVGGKVTIGGANNLETVDESFDLTTQIFSSPMIPNSPPFDPHDYGFDDPGFFALGSDRTADFPPGTSPLPAGANVTVHFPNFTVAGHMDTLFYWNGSGAVNFQPISTTQPGYAIAVGANPVGATSSPNPPSDTSFGALHEHPGFTLDNGGPGIPADGVYLNAASISVTGLSDSKNYYYVWVIDSLIDDGDKAEELRDALLDHVVPPIVDGKDFTFVNNAIGYVQSNLVSVPEPSTTALLAIVACTSLLPANSRRRKSAVLTLGARS
jgi:hypothetical protein